MLKRNDVPFVSILVCWLVCGAHAQIGSAAAEPVVDRKVVVVTSEAKSDSVIAIPTATSVTVSFQSEKHATTMDLAAWLQKETALNGLESADLQPWHLVVIYDQFDEDGDNVHSGVYEEF